MGSLKENKCFRSLLLVIFVVTGMILIDWFYGLGEWGAYSLAPISVVGYFVSFYCGWLGATMAIVGNAILSTYVLSVAPDPFIIMPRGMIVLVSNTIGYSMLAYQTEVLTDLKTKKVLMEDLQIAKFRIIFDEAKEHLLSAMALIRKGGVTNEIILKELEVVLDRMAHPVTQAQVARALANDRKELGLEE